MKTSVPLFILLLTWSMAASAATEIRGHVLAAGGGKTTTANHAMYYTIGQALVGGGSTTNHILGVGFWGASPHVTAVEPSGEPLQPRADCLWPIYPNPFNPTTTVQYDLAGQADYVRLSVYDVAGRLVTTLVDGVQGVGRQTVTWRGEDSNGRQVSTGVYLLVLDTPRARLTRKMVLMR